MDVSEARRLLGVAEHDKSEVIRDAYLERRRLAEDQIATAPTEPLRDKLRERLESLQAAFRVLVPAREPEPEAARVVNPPAPPPLTATKMYDLPGVSPFATPSGVPGALVDVGIRPGDVLSGRYEVGQQIGAGGMGAVFEALDRTRGQKIAMKVLLPALDQDTEQQERFLNEAKLSSELSHPNIVNVFDVQQHENHSFFTMELLRGQTLRQRLIFASQRKELIPLDEAQIIARSVCDALSYAHGKTVHRDIKPENIWLCDDGTVKLMDFGIARILRQSQLTRTAMTMGTAYYMAPEQISLTADVDHRADQYSLAAVLYEMLTGVLPAGRIKSARELRPDVPAGLSFALDKALDSSADGRFADVAAFQRALERRGPILQIGATGKVAAAAVLAAVLIAGGYPLWGDGAGVLFAGLLRDPALVAKVEEKRAETQALAGRWMELAGVATSEHRDQADAALAGIAQADALFGAKRDRDALNAYMTRAASLEASIDAVQDSLHRAALESEEIVTALQTRIEALQKVYERQIREADSRVTRAESYLRSARSDRERADAERDLELAREEKSAAEALEKTADAEIFNNDAYMGLKGKVRVGRSMLQKGDYLQARDAFDTAQNGMSDILDSFAGRENLVRARQRSVVLQRQWNALEGRYSGRHEEQINFAKRKLVRGMFLERQGENEGSAQAYQEANGAYEDLIRTAEEALEEQERRRLAQESMLEQKRKDAAAAAAAQRKRNEVAAATAAREKEIANDRARREQEQQARQEQMATQQRVTEQRMAAVQERTQCAQRCAAEMASCQSNAVERQEDCMRQASDSCTNNYSTCLAGVTGGGVLAGAVGIFSGASAGQYSNLSNQMQQMQRQCESQYGSCNSRVSMECPGAQSTQFACAADKARCDSQC